MSELTVMEPATEAPEDRKPASVIRIAIADDHPIFRNGLRQILGLQQDFAVVAEARDGEEAWQIIEEHSPDILLLDLNMPRAGGMGILQRLQNKTGGTKVIVLTASDDKNEFIQAMRLGAAGIVLKRSPTELLLKSIRKVHAGEIWLDSQTTAAVMQQFAAGDDGPVGQGRERAPLSPREREIVALVAQGFKNKEMAGKMFISEQTVKNHLHNIFDKLGVSDRLELALYAIHKNLHQG